MAKEVNINIAIKGEGKTFNSPEFQEIINNIRSGKFQKELQHSMEDKVKIKVTISGV